MSQLKVVSAFVVLDADGERVVAKYFNTAAFADGKAEKEFEKKIFAKTYKTNARAEAEIIMMDGLVCVYRTVRDVLMYVVGTEHVNEVMLADMLNSLYQGFSALLKKQIEKRYILECLDLILLTLDEVFDDGIILESNPDAIVDLVGVRSESDVPLSEQTITQAFLKVRDKMDKFMK